MARIQQNLCGQVYKDMVSVIRVAVGCRKRGIVKSPAASKQCHTDCVQASRWRDATDESSSRPCLACRSGDSRARQETVCSIPTCSLSSRAFMASVQCCSVPDRLASAPVQQHKTCPLSPNAQKSSRLTRLVVVWNTIEVSCCVSVKTSSQLSVESISHLLHLLY